MLPYLKLFLRSTEVCFSTRIAQSNHNLSGYAPSLNETFLDLYIVKMYTEFTQPHRRRKANVLSYQQ